MNKLLLTFFIWIEKHSTFVLAATAFLAPAVVERWKSRYWSPEIKIHFKLTSPDCHLTQAKGGGFDYPVYYFRLLVENVGKTQADDCEVILEKLYKENNDGSFIEFKNFTPVNLKWSGIRDPYKRTLQPGRKMFCDIGRIQHPSQNYSSFYREITSEEQKQLKFVFELPDLYYSQWDCLIKGKYKIFITIYSKNAKKISKELHVSWSGIWKDKDDEMFNELVIS